MNSILKASVRARAYAIWEREGRPEGRAMEHWFMAEREVAGEVGPTRAPAQRRRTATTKQSAPPATIKPSSRRSAAAPA
jgi:hypothetical protein